MINPAVLPEQFYLDLAVGLLSFEEICDNYELPEEDLDDMVESPIYQRRLRLAIQAVEDDGRAFKARCRTLVTDNLHRVTQIMADPEAPASTRLEAFKTLVKFGELEPVKQEQAQASGPSLSLTIVAPGGERTEHSLIEAQPINPDDEADEFNRGRTLVSMFGAE